MRNKFFISVALMAFCSGVLIAQIENVMIETYYISDTNDATDTIGGHLEKESVTYRIFIDLLPGSKILSIYGDAQHPLVFLSTASFFNHRQDGITFGKDFGRIRYGNGTVPLDTYLTLGQCSRSFSQGAYFGVPKVDDHDGSVVGGENNDGGSGEIGSGLLTHGSDDIGIPLVQADGLAFKNALPTSWIDIGFIDILTSSDTTMFGSTREKNSFYSTMAQLRCSGASGVDPGENTVLVAQLTTKGELSFEINLEVEIMNDNGELQIIKYVARNTGLAPDEVFVPLLNFPYECGCTDPDYLESSTAFACTDNSRCITPIVLGCMDSLACNYDPHANFNVTEICCYVGYCHDLDIGVVCPVLLPRQTFDRENIKLYPNPASSDLQIELDFVHHNDIDYIIFDVFGCHIKKGVVFGHDKQISISELARGYYQMQLEIDDRRITIPFVKM